MKRNIIKMKGKKALSMLLAMVITLSVIMPSLSTVSYAIAHESVGIGEANGVHTAIIAVPETVYMTPSAGESTTGQYYVNNDVNTDAGFVIVPEAESNNENGHLEIFIPNAKQFYIEVNTITSGIGDVVLAASGATSGTYEQTTFNLDANGYFNFDLIGLYINGKGLSAGQTAVAEWVFTITMNDDSTRTYYAYTTLYAPYYIPVGAAAEAWSNQGISDSWQAWLGSILWVEGVHNITTSNYSGAEHWYPRTDNFLPMVGAFYSSGFNNRRPSGDWIQNGSNGLFSSVTYLEGDGSNHRRVNVVSPLAHLAVDTSRYDNFSQIPNFKVGYMITDSENTDNGKYYVADYTGYDYENGDEDGKDLGSYSNGGSEKSRREDYYNAPHGTEITSGSEKGCTVKYHDSWNRTISTGTVMLKAAAGANETSGTTKRSAWNNNFVEINVVGVDKTTLRSLVVEGSGFNGANYTASTWSAYKAALESAATALGNPTATADAVSTAVNTLTQKRNALKTNLTLDANGGTIDGAATKVDTITVGVGTTIDLNVGAYNTPVREGYTFKGWSEDKNATSGTTDTITVGLMDTIYATWQGYPYTIKFNSNGGTGSMNALSMVYGTAKNLTANAFTKTGYTFNGWNTQADGSGTSYKNSESVNNLTSTNNGEVTLYAQWKPNQYTVEFNANYDDGPTKTQTFNYDKAKNLDSAFVRKQYIFKGWSTASDGAVEYSDRQSVINLTATPNGKVTLYAKWEKLPYELTYDNLFIFTKWAESASARLTIDANKKGTMEIDADAGSIKFTNTLTDADTTDGFLANDFHTSNGFGNGHYNIKVTEGVRYTFEYTTSGGTGDQVHVWFYDDNGNAIESIENRGYPYVGAYGRGNSTSWLSFTVPQGATNICLRFGSTKTAETVTFSNMALYREDRLIQAGMMDWDTRLYRKVYHDGEVVGNPQMPTRPGYTLKEVYVDNHNDGIINDVEGVGNDSTSKLSSGVYAGLVYGDTINDSYILLSDWGGISYTITFDGNNATNGSMEDIPMVYGEEKRLPVNEYTKTGYTFGGWQDASGKPYGDNTFVNNLTTENDGIVTLTAKWNANSYTVIFDSNNGTGTTASQDITYDTTVALDLNTFAKEGYTFDCWKDEKGTAYSDGADVKNLAESGNITLTAQWKPNTYTIEFNAGDGGTGNMTAMSVTYDEASNLTANTFTKTGYSFAGWSGSNGEKYADKESVKNLATENGSIVTLTAQWEENSYTITYNANGGEGEKTQTVKYTESVTLPTTGFTRVGYTFIGWNSQADGNGKTYGANVSELSAAQNGAVTIYAVWQINSSALVADKIGVDFCLPITINPVSNDDILLEEAKKSSYTFLGFSTTETGDYITSLDGTYGSFVMNGENITYTPKGIVINGAENKLYYHIEIKGIKLSGTVSVVPASNVYYEETIATDKEVSGTVEWVTGQENQSVSLISDENGKEIYGYNTAYDNTNKFSNNSYLSASVKYTAKKSDTKVFDFVGSGFDLIGACGANTGVQIVKVSVPDTESATGYSAIKTFIVDTYFTDTNIMTDGLLHQVPIVNFRGAYGAYQIETTATYLNSAGAVKAGTAKTALSSGIIDTGIAINSTIGEPTYTLLNELEALGFEDLGEDVEVVWMDENSVFNGGTGARKLISGSADLYFGNNDLTLLNYIDGFRVYNPLDGGKGYYIDTEQNATYYNIVNHLSTGSGSDNFVYIESGNENFPIPELDGKFDFTAYNSQGGPKSEIYLNPGKGIAFTFEANSNGTTADVMLGMRAVFGTANVKIYDASKGSYVEKNIQSKTEMYYDVSDVAKVVVDENDDTKGNVTIIVVNEGSGVMALNNLKLINGPQSKSDSADNPVIMGNTSSGALAPTPVVPDAVTGAEGNTESIPETDVDTDTDVPETDVEEETENNISVAIPGLPAPIASFLEMLFKLLGQLVGSLGF